MQDIGADRGWLLSEKGFQAGAISCAEKTNITLTSLECLRKEDTEYIREVQIKSLLFRIEGMQWDLQNCIATKRAQADPKKGFWHPPLACIGATGKLSMFEYALKRGLHGDYPIVCDAIERDEQEAGVVAHSHEELITIIGKIAEGYGQIVENAKNALEDDEI